jgi:hypothetical protein
MESLFPFADAIHINVIEKNYTMVLQLIGRLSGRIPEHFIAFCNNGVLV